MRDGKTVVLYLDTDYNNTLSEKELPGWEAILIPETIVPKSQ